MSAPRFDPTASLKRVRDAIAPRRDGTPSGTEFSRGYAAAVDATLSLIDAEIALQGQVDRAAEMALECVGYREPRFDPTEARALIADLREDADEMDRHYGGGQREPERSWIRNIRSAARELTLALTAISAIEDPEDGAGLREAFCIAYGYKEMPDIALETAPIEYDEFARFKAAVRRLATHAPSESAVTIEMVARLRAAREVFKKEASAASSRSRAFEEAAAFKLGEAHAIDAGFQRAQSSIGWAFLVCEDLIACALERPAEFASFIARKHPDLEAALTPKDQITREARDE